MNNKLIKSSEIDSLNIETVWDLYRKYINNSQVDLISTFGFGNDTVLVPKVCIFIQIIRKKY